jgi:AcrR family transcriptional regulator
MCEYARLMRMASRSVIITIIEMSQPPAKRKYELKDRARKQEETRARIIGALIELHETVGAARTTVTDVARIAGVNRMTVYKHFATEAEMVEACTSHWIELHPPPDAQAWAAIRDPDERLAVALGELYAYYRTTEAMWSTAYRDAALVESLGTIMNRTWFVFLSSGVEILAAGRGARGRRRERLLAALRLALDFPTWRTLTASGLDDPDAADVAVGFVTAATASPASVRRAA